MLAIIGFACKMILAVAWSSTEKSAFCAWTRKCRNWQTQPAKPLHIHNSTENTTHMHFGNLEIILSLGLCDVSTDGQKALHELRGLESLQSENCVLELIPDNSASTSSGCADLLTMFIEFCSGSPWRTLICVRFLETPLHLSAHEPVLRPVPLTSRQLEPTAC